MVIFDLFVLTQIWVKNLKNVKMTFLRSLPYLGKVKLRILI